MDRRKFAIDLALNGAGLALGFLSGEAFAYERKHPTKSLKPKSLKRVPQSYHPTGEILVSLFLRGACDGLNLVPPHSGKDRELYESARPNVQIARDQLLKLDDRFGLHPSARALHALYEEKKLAFVHCAGLPSDSRSHFDAQAFMELGTPGKKGTSSGWLARHLEGAREDRPSLVHAVGVGSFSPLSLLGDDRGVEAENPATFGIPGDPRLAGLYLNAVREMYGSAPSDWLTSAGVEALGAWEAISTVAERAKGADAGEYPKGEIGNRLRATALLLKSGLGVRAAAVDMGGWDTHKYQGAGSDGAFAHLVEQLSESLNAFQKDLAGTKITVLVMTEFGRRVRENASRGTDHGHGSVMMALGEGVRGGRVYGEWAGLATERLYDRADLAVTTDYRQVLSEALEHRMGDARRGEVFPDFKPAARELGLFKAYSAV